jgi:DNA-binding MarR family transcriptional regulator
MGQAAPDLDHGVGYAAKQLNQAFRTVADKALRPVGLTLPQFAVLSSLAERPGSSNSELARGCFVTRQSMNEVLAGLLAAGLITRSAHPIHGRVLQTELTPAGQEAIARADAIVQAVEARMTAGLTDEQRQQLLQLIGVCTANLS